MPAKLGVFISGRGSNMNAILQNIQQKKLDAVVSVVICNRKNAKGLEVATSNDIPAFTILPETYSSHNDYELAIIKIIKEYDIDLIILAGYMKLIKSPLLSAYHNRILNIHPSLLPSFKGLNAQKQALDYGVKVSGCTVHYVVEEMDAGPIVMQSAVPVLEDDTEDTLSSRILLEEHRIYSESIQQVIDTLSHDALVHK